MTGFGLVLFVALAAGEPPIALELPGAKEIFQGSQGEYLNDSGNAGSAGSAAAPRGRPRVDTVAGSKPSPKPAVHQTANRQPVRPGLSSWIELVERPGHAGQRVSPTRPFRSGETIRLHFESNLDGHIWIAQVDPSGSTKQLFPDPEKGLTDDRLTAFVPRALPSEAHWLRFDNQLGEERLLVVFSPDRAPLEAMQLAERGAGQKILSLAQERLGSKGLLVEAEDAAPAENALYTVSLDGSPVVQEIILIHH